MSDNNTMYNTTKNNISNTLKYNNTSDKLKYNNSPDIVKNESSSRKFVWIILLIVFIIFIIFIVIVILFFVFRQPPTHEIKIHNNSSSKQILKIGSFEDDRFFFSDINSNEDIYVYATPGSNLSISIVLSDRDIEFTKAIIQLAGKQYNGEVIISQGNNSLKNLSKNNLPKDQYSISLQNGYIMPMSIKSTNTNSTEDFICNGPEFFDPILGTGTTGDNICPSDLQYINQNDYIGCQSACNKDISPQNVFCCELPFSCSLPGSCQSLWIRNPEYYSVFSQACPNCMITNCDELNYFCSNDKELTTYEIVLSP